MTAEIGAVGRVVGAVIAARRYRHVDPALVLRLATEELARARSESEAVKRVKRRLHQAVTAYRPGRRSSVRELARIEAAWTGSLADAAFRDACRSALSGHASTRERLPYLDQLYPAIWARADGAPSSVLDLGCGLHPLSLPWMGLAPDAAYHAIDVDAAQLATVDRFLALVGQPHGVHPRDLAAGAPSLPSAELALVLKLVPLLDRQDPRAATRLLRGLDVRRAVVSFPVRSLGGRARGMERTYRTRFETLVADMGARCTGVAEASVPNELVFVVSLSRPEDATDG